jgi:hypothetical protein
MKLLSIIFILVFGLSVFGQSVLVNSDVIEMVKTGLSAEIIAAKIRSSDTKFDTTTPALKTLAESKVPDAVIVAMLEKEQVRREQSKIVQKDNDKDRDAIPEQGTLADIKGKKKIYILTNDIKARDLIVKEIADNGEFQVVDKIEDCDFVLNYESEIVDIGASAVVGANTGTVRRLTQLNGKLNVIMPALDGNPSRIRLVYSTLKSKYYVWTDNPAKSTTKQFLKDLEKIASSKK